MWWCDDDYAIAIAPELGKYFFWNIKREVIVLPVEKYFSSTLDSGGHQGPPDEEKEGSDTCPPFSPDNWHHKEMKESNGPNDHSRIPGFFPVKLGL